MQQPSTALTEKYAIHEPHMNVVTICFLVSQSNSLYLIFKHRIKHTHELHVFIRIPPQDIFFFRINYTIPTLNFVILSQISSYRDLTPSINTKYSRVSRVLGISICINIHSK